MANSDNTLSKHSWRLSIRFARTLPFPHSLQRSRFTKLATGAPAFMPKPSSFSLLKTLLESAESDGLIVSAPLDHFENGEPALVKGDGPRHLPRRTAPAELRLRSKRAFERHRDKSGDARSVSITCTGKPPSGPRSPPR